MSNKYLNATFALENAMDSITSVANDDIDLSVEHITKLLNIKQDLIIIRNIIIDKAKTPMPPDTLIPSDPEKTIVDNYLPED